MAEISAVLAEIEDLNRNSAELLVEKLREDNFFATVLDDQATELAQLQTAEDIMNADGALETDPLLHEEMAYYSGLPEVWEEASLWSYQSAKESKEIADKQKSEAVKKIQKMKMKHLRVLINPLRPRFQINKTIRGKLSIKPHPTQQHQS